MKRLRNFLLIVSAICAGGFLSAPALAAVTARGAAARTDYIVLHDCDSAWDATTTLDRENQRQGLACVVAESTGESSNTQVLINQTLFAPTHNELRAEDANFRFWFWIDDVDALGAYGGHKYFAIELGSRDECDVDEYEFNLMKYVDDGTIRSGEWTYLCLPFSEAIKAGNPDLNAMKRVRFLTRGEKRTMKLDMLSIQRRGYTGEVLCPIQYKDVLTDNVFAGAVTDTEHYVERASARITGADIAFVNEEANFGFTNLRAETFGVSAWIRTEQPVAAPTLTLGDGARTLSYAYGDGLREGWNFVVFDAENLTAGAADFDYENIVSFRLALGNETETTANLERVRVVNTQVAFNYYPYGYADEATGKTFSADTSDVERFRTMVYAVEITATVLLAAGLAATLFLLLKDKKKSK